MWQIILNTLLILTLYSSQARSPDSRSAQLCRCSPPAYSDSPAASFSSEPPSTLQTAVCRVNTVNRRNVKYTDRVFSHVERRALRQDGTSYIAATSMNPGISYSLWWWILCEKVNFFHDLTSLLGVSHHLFVLLSMFLGLLSRFGRQIT